MIKIDKLNPFGRMCLSMGMIPSSYAESLTYEEQLLWFCNFLEKQVIPAVNKEGEAIEELQNLYIELKSYVDNYFDNLDIQEEINNKLDDMAESGQLADIIAQYLGLAGVLAFNTINDMSEGVNLEEGSICYTLGKTSYNDGEGAFYKVRTVTSGDVVDGINIVALDVSDTLIAERLKDKIRDNLVLNTSSFVTPELFGCSGDGTTDDTENMQDAIDYAITNNIPLFAFKNYLISEPLKINGKITIYGSKNNKLVDSTNVDYNFIYSGTGYLFDTDNEYNISLFENLTIKGNSSASCFKNTGYRNTYKNVTIANFDKGINFYGDISTWRGENLIEDCLFDSNIYAIKIDDVLYCDSYIRGTTFIHDTYSIYGSFNSWVLSLSHDYSTNGIYIDHFSNSEIVDNYLDHSSHMPFIYASADYQGGSIIANNKFLAGDGITSQTALIQIDNNTLNYNLTIANNVASGTKYSNSYFVEFLQTTGITLSMSGNQMFKIVGKILKNYPLGSAGSMTNYSGYKTVTDITGTANFNFCFFNNGVAHLILEVSSATITLGVLPFKPAIAVRVPIFNSTDKTWDTALLNTNGNITIPSGFASKTVLLNATYMVYYNGTFGDNT